jgi:hypothetical protein
VLAAIPKGTAMYVQLFIVNAFGVFKNHYYDVAEEQLEANDPRSKVKLSFQSRILCTRFTKSA